ncbi:preprotein translocase subunit SecG [Mycoplasmopsis bovigenitalium]|uniref:Protein-export membrane protein SecG n=1 Tax=Mycoplasmopsis bovigenitalium TaxID=2112 RepID=A0A449A9W8_9BACT|nr:preprotein translocase subunit SecG [Mycoplasmopsis bovigenitalium]VEU61073.1 preprotein translocase subunit SecG [Mycoplasmopsis bovigenitalium]
MLTLIVSIIILVVAVIIIIVSLIMSPDSNGFSGALVGSSDLQLFKTSKERGTKKFLKRAMLSLGVGLIILALLLKIFVK